METFSANERKEKPMDDHITKLEVLWTIKIFLSGVIVGQVVMFFVMVA